MSKSVYIGDTSGKARKVPKAYIGDVNGVARKIVKGYIGDTNNIARLFFSADGGDPMVGYRYVVPSCSMSSSRSIGISFKTMGSVTTAGTYHFTYYTLPSPYVGLGWIWDEDPNPDIGYSKAQVLEKWGWTYTGTPQAGDTVTQVLNFVDGTVGTHYNPNYIYNSASKTCLAIFKTGKFIPVNSGNVDIFLLGGGGSGGSHMRTYYRYYDSEEERYITVNTNYPVSGNDGGATKFKYINDPNDTEDPTSTTTYTASGGDCGNPTEQGEYGTDVYAHGGSGGSGGGGVYCGATSASVGNGGTNGSDGEGDYGGSGQGTNSTRAFQESNGNLFGGGGGAAYYGYYHYYENVKHSSGGSPNGTEGVSSGSSSGAAGGYGAGTGGQCYFSSNLTYTGFIVASGGGSGCGALCSNYFETGYTFLRALEYPVYIGEGGAATSHTGKASNGLVLIRNHGV